MSFELSNIKNKFKIADQIWDYAIKGIGEKTLCDIYYDYIEKKDFIKREQSLILESLDELLGSTCYIRTRIKDKEHLIEKIVRNYTEKAATEKYQGINEKNYHNIITDLIGFRILLFERNKWEKVNAHLMKTYEYNADFFLDKKDQQSCDNPHFAEEPKAYIVDEDPEAYRKKRLTPDDSKAKIKYRSLHYTVKHKSFYSEIQVRTIFDEGWLEFDHLIKYPYDKDNIMKCDLLLLLSNIAKTADDMILFHSKYEAVFNENGKVDKQKKHSMTTKDVLSNKNKIDTNINNTQLSAGALS